ncbi:hypothetical protein N9V74_00205 [Alteromonas sp.]|nr:hypothetical protein [Alteromonas sp.]
MCILLVAIAVYTAHRYQSAVNTTQGDANEIGNRCTFVNGRCELLIVGERAVAIFSDPVETETSITLTLSLSSNITLESAWIEGVNMYMGKVPVLLEKDSTGVWTGWFMLGSCSEPTMRWQLRLNIKEQAAPSYLYFSTQR